MIAVKEGMKRCKRCERWKDRSEYYTRPAYADGLDPCCKDCRRERNRMSWLKRKALRDTPPITLAQVLDRCREHGTWRKPVLRAACQAVCYELARLTTEERDSVLSQALARYAHKRFPKPDPEMVEDNG